MSDKLIIISKSKLDTLADTIKSKSGATDNLTLDELIEKVNNIEADSPEKELWEWALNNVFNFGSANPTFFKGMTYLKVLPNYFNEECAKITNWSNAFNGCSNLVDIDIDTSAGTNFSNIFYQCTKLNIIKNMDTSKGQNFTNAFRGCKSLTDETIKNLKFDNITNGFGMFSEETKITKLPAFNHETITNISEMFNGCTLEDLGDEDLIFPNVTSADYAFAQTNIRLIKNIDLPKVTKSSCLFYNCDKLTTISNLNIPKTTNTYRMFSGATSLIDIPELDTSKVGSMDYMFHNCSNLEKFPTLDLTSATNISYLFQGCSKMKTVKLVNVPDRNFTVNYGSGTVYVFNNCASLEKIERTANPLCRGNCDNFASGCTSLIEFDQDTSKVTSFYHMFDGDTSLETIKTIDGTVSQGFVDTFKNCSALKNIEITPGTIKLNISFADSPLLTDEAIQNIVNGLAIVTSQQTLTLHPNVKSKLTDEQNSAIASKNWKVA